MLVSVQEVQIPASRNTLVKDGAVLNTACHVILLFLLLRLFRKSCFFHIPSFERFFLSIYLSISLPAFHSFFISFPFHSLSFISLFTPIVIFFIYISLPFRPNSHYIQTHSGVHLIVHFVGQENHYYHFWLHFSTQDPRNDIRLRDGLTHLQVCVLSFASQKRRFWK